MMVKRARRSLLAVCTWLTQRKSLKTWQTWHSELHPHLTLSAYHACVFGCRCTDSSSRWLPYCNAEGAHCTSGTSVVTFHIYAVVLSVALRCHQCRVHPCYTHSRPDDVNAWCSKPAVPVRRLLCQHTGSSFGSPHNSLTQNMGPCPLPPYCCVAALRCCEFKSHQPCAGWEHTASTPQETRYLSTPQATSCHQTLSHAGIGLASVVGGGPFRSGLHGQFCCYPVWHVSSSQAVYEQGRWVEDCMAEHSIMRAVLHAWR